MKTHLAPRGLQKTCGLFDVGFNCKYIINIPNITSLQVNRSINYLASHSEFENQNLFNNQMFDQNLTELINSIDSSIDDKQNQISSFENDMELMFMDKENSVIIDTNSSCSNKASKSRLLNKAREV